MPAPQRPRLLVPPACTIAGLSVNLVLPGHSVAYAADDQLAVTLYLAEPGEADHAHGDAPEATPSS